MVFVCVSCLVFVVLYLWAFSSFTCHLTGPFLMNIQSTQNDRMYSGSSQMQYMCLLPKIFLFCFVCFVFVSREAIGVFCVCEFFLV